MANILASQALPSLSEIGSRAGPQVEPRVGQVDRWTRWRGGIRDGWRSGWELVWPVSCAGCGRPDVPVCDSCRAAVAGPAFRTPVVGWPLGFQAWAACGYRGRAARMLIAWKERGRVDLTEPLGAGLGAAVRALRAARGDPESQWLLIPIPSTRGARRRRGGDLVFDLTRRAAEVNGSAPVRPVRALEHARRVRDQGSLSAVGRRANLRGALSVRSGALELVSGRECVIVDDVVTTGTTAAEAARALTSVGARVVGACFLSVTLRQLGVPEEGLRD